jgi:hypothetical protein
LADDRIGIITSFQSIGVILLNSKQFENAIGYFVQARRMYKNIFGIDFVALDYYLSQIKAEIGPTRYQEILDGLPIEAKPTQ